MKKFLIVLLFQCCISLCKGQYWQQRVNYIIDVNLNDKEKSLDAFEKLTYLNNSPDTLSFIWFHLWPNAYKNDRTAFSDQMLLNGNTSFYFSDKDQKGYINRLDFKVDGTTAKTEDHPQYTDVIKLLLPKQLLPGQQVQITTPFHVKLPFNFSRGGYDSSTFQITQWYPKPAVYDSKGWHPMPYLDQGEFFSEFGSFDVRITVPKEYTIAATGNIQNPEDTIGSGISATITKKLPLKKKPSAIHNRNIKKPKPVSNSATEIFIPVETKTLHYLQDSVHDFAWFANKEFIYKRDTCILTSGRIIFVNSYYTQQEELIWKHSVQFAKDAIHFYSNEVGEYLFNTVTVVQGPKSFGGGMEYPTITVISPPSSAEELDEMIAHEIGHNWFYAILASNEREHPWMDEGINSFYEYKYIDHKYGKQTEETEITFQTRALRNRDQPIETSSEKFNIENYNLSAYHKTAVWMKMIEDKAGVVAFRNMMHYYFKTWQFRHPYPNDFKACAQSVLGNATDSVFDLLNKRGILPGHELNGFSFISPLKKSSIKNYLDHPVKDILFISPAIGVNSYDKLMVGSVITNYKAPPDKFQFLIIPLYSTGSKTLAGLGKINYSIISNHFIRKTDIFLNESAFSMDQIKDTAGNDIKLRFKKLVPGIKLTFRQADPLSTIYRYVQWKTFIINEQYLNNIINDTIINGADTTKIPLYDIRKQNRYLNQLQFVYENYRELYPFHFNLQIEQAQDFLRPTFTFNYFFNYSKGGGMQLRLFAGKFIYLNGKTIQKQFDNDRYFLNMTGPNGFEDYTYSDYFIGRNRFEGVNSQQIMIRDGAFKIKTDLLSSKIGKTDKWLAAINLSSSLPKNINPLSMLPVKIPLKAFLDVGTYAEAWQQNSGNDHFLYDLGLQIPLFNQTINIYIPLLYSKVYSDYIKSVFSDNRFWKKISFSINLYNQSLRKLNRELEF